MKILAVETGSNWCSVAIKDGHQPALQRMALAPRSQTAVVLPMIKSLLSEYGWALNQLDGIAFGQGPGAFTGVRVASSVVQGLAFSLNLPVVGVSSLASCALNAAWDNGHGPWLAAFDARMNEVYVGAYVTSEDGVDEVILDDCLCAPNAPLALPFDRYPQGSWKAAGDGCDIEALKASIKLDYWFAEAAPSAAAVAHLALDKFNAGNTLSAEQAQPVYLRNQVIQGAVK